MNRMYFMILTVIIPFVSFAQMDLESLLPINNNSQIVINTFKSTRIINSHSVELFEPNQLDLRISHRFGQLNGGLYELYGLDQAKVRVGFEYGLINNLMIGFGRSTYDKTYDGFLKVLLIQQKKDSNFLPFSVVFFSNVAVNSLKKDLHTNSNGHSHAIKYPFQSRLSFSHQLLIASKINRKLSIQLMPSLVHFNMVEFMNQHNQSFLIGGGFRYLISKSISINSEYFFRLNPSDYDKSNYNNSFSFGVDIETGGHVFQLHLTNSMPMHESGFLTRTYGSWSEGGVHFGFNISREFKL
tara:strand:- start:10132 stop:11025 length:894 start_codon:yes stop_codon:yes gene_type:complete